MKKIGLCGDCAYWAMSSHDHHAGECRRYPPTLIPNGPSLGVWPGTKDDGGCGEFETKGTLGGEWTEMVNAGVSQPVGHT